MKMFSSITMRIVEDLEGKKYGKQLGFIVQPGEEEAERRPHDGLQLLVRGSRGAGAESSAL